MPTPRAPIRQRRQVTRSALPDLLVRLPFAIGFYFLFPAFSYQLAFDMESGQFTESALLKVISAACFAYALAIILSSRDRMETAVKSWPILLLVALAAASTVWSVSPDWTLRRSFALLTTVLFGLAIAGRLSQLECLRFVVRVMAFGCALSIIWVVIFPAVAVHQATDLVQNVHAGLWRGIFSHKQALGVFSGLTTGLLLFYGSVAFASPIVRAGALACGVTCLVGSGSATGLVAVIVTSAMLYLTHVISRSPPQFRILMVRKLEVALLFLAGLFYSGILNTLAALFGKSADLSGRTDYWAILLQGVANLGRSLLGGGYDGNLSEYILPGVGVDSGYVQTVIDFGYLGAAIVFGVYIWVLLAGMKLIVRASPDNASVAVFPASLTCALLCVGITEPVFLGKNLYTVLIAIAVAQIAREKTVQRARTAAAIARSRPT